MKYALTLFLPLFVFACGEQKSPTPVASPREPVTALCLELAELVALSNANFPDLGIKDKPARFEGVDGFASSRVITGAQRCLIFQREAEYADLTMACQLAAVGSKAAAVTVLATWSPLIRGCPVIKGWVEDTHEGSVQWAMETADNHLNRIRLYADGDEPSLMPVLTIGRPEI